MDRTLCTLIITHLLLGVALLPGPVRAGLVPDPSFGTGGITWTDFGGNDTPNDLLIQPDGSILVAGQSVAAGGAQLVALSRYDANGIIDSAGFGTDGKVAVNFVLRDYANALAVDDEGRIVAVGMQMESSAVSSQNASIYRFLSDGTVDETFGTGGFVAGRFDGVSSCEYGSVRTYTGGSIHVGGRCNANANGGAHGFGAESFDVGGLQTFSFRRTSPIALSFTRGASVLYDDGRVLWAAVAGNAPYQFVLARSNANGLSDASFNGGATLLTGIPGSNNSDVGLVVQEDGRILVAGTMPRDIGGTQFVVMRLLADGTPDSTFAGTGILPVSVGVGNSADQFHDMAIDAVGRILLAGRANTAAANSRQVGMARVLPNGTLDPAFPDGGTTLIDLNGAGSDHFLTRIVPLPDGSILGAGWDSSHNGGDFFLVRFQNPDATATAVSASTALPFALNVFPNPGHGNATIRFELTRAQAASLDVFDASGRLVRRLFGGTLPLGLQAVTWDGRDGAGHAVASGIYFGRLRSDEGEAAVRIVRVR